MLSFSAIGVVVAQNPSDVSGAGSNPVWRLIFCEKLFMKLENFIILSNGTLINLRYLKTITPDHTSIRMRDDSFLYYITEEDYKTILDNINVVNSYDDN